MSEDVQPLTQAQTKWIMGRVQELWKSGESVGLYEQALEELTAKPGEKLHCQECGLWRDWEVREHSKLCKVPWHCAHAEAREGFCPEEGGDKE